MRYLIIYPFACLLSVCLMVSCSEGLFKKDTADAEAAEVPTDLEGPAYDPSISPQPLTPSTILPRPGGAAPPAAYGNTAEQPQAYGQSVPQAYGTPAGPEEYPPATTALSPGQNTKGHDAPRTYAGAPAVYAAPQAAAALSVATTLDGLWVNTTDEKEVVEFTTDHYTTFYDGEMLLREPMTYHPLCPGDCNGGAPMDIACFTVSGPAGTDCYGVVRLTPEVLELSMLGVSTETIVYRKR